MIPFSEAANQMKSDNITPGEYLLEQDPITANLGRKTARVVVKHTGDRPVQVGSHYHFFEVNNALHFSRGSAQGMRLNIAAGTSVRFEPGEEKEVELTEYAGHCVVLGHQGLGSIEKTSRGKKKS